MSKKKKKKRKRKRDADLEAPPSSTSGPAPSAELSRRPEDHKFDPSSSSSTRGRDYTVSVAIPGSIVANAQSPELRTYLVGQIARALSIFCVDEVVVFSENGSAPALESEFKGASRHGNPDLFMARVLQYLETPQYLRKELFPMHKDLRYAGLLNPLDAPHHMRADAESEFREGVTVRRPTKPGAGSWANVGLRQCARLGVRIEPGVRVTVRLSDASSGSKKKVRVLEGRAVAPSTPRTERGLYWGYTTRVAGGLGRVLSECPYDGGYDLTIGTSERGTDAASEGFKLPPFRHMLIVFGGLGGLEDAIEGDESLPVGQADSLFRMYINSCANQGSRTIRTEEALPITLSLLRPHILKNQAAKVGPMAAAS